MFFEYTYTLHQIIIKLVVGSNEQCNCLLITLKNLRPKVSDLQPCQTCRAVLRLVNYEKYLVVNILDLLDYVTLVWNTIDQKFLNFNPTYIPIFRN